MKVTRISKSEHQITPQTKEQLYNIIKILKEADIKVLRPMYEEKPLVVKRKQKKVFKEFHFEKVKLALKTISPVISAVCNGKNKTYTLKVNETIMVYKKLSPQQISFLKTLQYKQKYYLAVSSTMILFGTIKYNSFHQITRKYLNLKQYCLVSQVLQFLKSKKDLLPQNCYFLCDSLFKQRLENNTDFQWDVLHNDPQKAWEDLSPGMVLDQDILTEHRRNRTKACYTTETVLQGLEFQNIEKVYLDYTADQQLFSNLYLTGDLKQNYKVQLIRRSSALENLMPEGVLAYRYF
jgi:hypothetical protein